MNLTSRFGRQTLVVFAVVFCYMLLIVQPIASAQESVDQIRDCASSEHPSAETPLKIWQPNENGTRISPEEAIELIWLLAGICAFGFIIFSIFIFIYRRSPAPSTKSFAKSQSKEPSISTED